MKKSRYLHIMLLLIFFIIIPVAKADVGELRYQITGFSINDNNRTITFRGWAFIHQTNNYNTIYKLVNGNDTNTSDIVTSGGGQKIKISAYDVNGNYIDSKSVDGNSKSNYNFTKRMYYRYDNTYNNFIADYNQENGTPGNMNCNINDTKSNCYYKDLYFEITFNIDENWYGKSVYFTIAVTNNDFKSKTGRNWTGEERLHILSDQYGGPNIYNNSNLIEIKENTTFNKVMFLAETALVKNSTFGGELGGYGYPGDIYLIEKYDENGSSGISGTEGVGRYFLYSSGIRACDLPGLKWTNKSCYYGSETVTNTVIGAWSSWIIPSGTSSFTIKINEIDNKCSVDNSVGEPLSCNNSQKLFSECNDLTVYEGNESAVVSIKQTGVVSSILAPTEIYNGGGIKFGLLYYNRIEFNYVRGSTHIDISDVMNLRISNYENISLKNIMIGNINVDSSYVKKQCTQKKGSNSVDTICLFYFTPQIVNDDGSIQKDDVDVKYDMGINNKYYLPLDYNPLYRLSASLVNASLLNEQQARKDGENNKVWYGNKWNEITLSTDGSCDINVYKLGPGSDYDSDSGEIIPRVIYNYIYRPIDLNNPFPGKNRFPGLNWYGWYNANKERLEDSYNSLQYSIELNNNVINKIKKYNSSHNYFNYNYDDFVKETGLKVGGNG